MEDQAHKDAKNLTGPDNLALSIPALAYTSQNLSSQDNIFIGRARELLTIEECFHDSGCRLLTLIGLGGVGKTRIAWEAGQQIAPQFAQGSCFISFAPIASPDLIIPTLASSLGYHFQGIETPQNQLIDFLRNREHLLVLDNFEHLLSSADLMSELLRAAPNLRLLITSRERLNLQQEWVLDIQGLDYPRDPSEDAVEHFSAVQFFLQCARRAKAGFQLTKANQMDVIRICRLVEGVPLGIELAASWVRMLSCQAIGDEIERNLDFLTTSLRDVPEKHQSLSVVFAHTYELLMADQRLSFSKLSVFRGGFQREAAEAVAGTALVTLAALLDKSLVRVAADDRYDMHELLRQYGHDQLEATGKGDLTRDAHSLYYADFMQQRIEDLKGRRQLQAMAEIKADFENIRTAWNWAAIHQREAIIDQMIDGIWLYCDIHDFQQEGQTLFRYAEQQFVPEHTTECFWSRLQARADGEAVEAQLEAALEIAQRRDDLAEIVFCLHRLARAVAYVEQAYPEAKRLLEQSLMYARRLGDRYVIAGVLFELQSFMHEETWENLERYGEESLRLSHEVGDRVGAAWSLSAVAIGYARAGRFEESERLWLERITLGREIGNLTLVALGYAHLSQKVYFFQGDFANARAAAETALRIADNLVDSNASVWALATLALLASIEENYTEAAQICRQVTSIRGRTWVADLAAWGLSIASCGLEDYKAARELLLTASNFLATIHGQVGIVACLSVAAIILAHTGNPVRAVELLALALTHPVGASGWMEKWALLARLRSELEQTLGYEAYSAAWEQGTLLDANGLFAQLPEAFADLSTVTKESVTRAGGKLLTEREIEILCLVTEGLSNRDIAAQLFLSPSTVKWYLSEIYSKMGANSRMQAVARARTLNLLA